MISYNPSDNLHPNPKPYDYIVGVDCGVNTGYAIYDCKTDKFISVTSTMIHRAMDDLRHGKREFKMFVRVEDARQVRFNTDKIKQQGAGSVKRDAKVWQDFLEDMKIPFEMVRPNKRITKWNAEQFKQYTGWEGRTNEHSRDAAMLAYKYKPKK